MHQRQKKDEKTARHPTNTRRLQRCKEHPRKQICKEKSTHHQDKEWERRSHHVSERDCTNVFGEFYKKLYDEYEQEIGENKNESSIDAQSSNTKVTMRIPEITTEELRTAINKLKKGKSPDSNGIRAEDIKTSWRWDERNGETNLQRNQKAEWVHSRGIEESGNKSDTQERWRGKCRKLPSDLLVVSVVQTVHDSTVQQIIPTTGPNTSGRSDGIQKLVPNNRSSSSMYRMIDQKCHERCIKMWAATINLMKTFELHHPQINVECSQIPRYRERLHQPPEEKRDLKATVLTDEESELFEIKKGTKQGDPLSSLLFNTSPAESIGRRHSALTKEKRYRKLPEWQRSWLSHKHEIYWRRAPVCNIKRTAPKNVMRIQEEYWKSGVSGSIQERRQFSAIKARTSEKKLRWMT